MEQQLKIAFNEKWSKYFKNADLPFVLFYSDDDKHADKHADEHSYATGHRDETNMELAPARCIEQLMPPPRCDLGVVQGPDYARFLVDEAEHVALIEGMIAKRQAICPGLQHGLRMGLRQPMARGRVFAIHDHEIEPPVLFQPGKGLIDGSATRAPHHIAKKKKSHGQGLGGSAEGGKRAQPGARTA